MRGAPYARSEVLLLVVRPTGRRLYTGGVEDGGPDGHGRHPILSAARRKYKPLADRALGVRTPSRPSPGPPPGSKTRPGLYYHRPRGSKTGGCSSPLGAGNKAPGESASPG